ncbi:MAG TPA: hypothetical protein VKQ72_20005 [Aggregatilineales bacterium]|nr:hypothetical protein [Aggregatilineales bacterium]
MRLKVFFSSLVTAVLLAVLPGLVSAQSPTFEWVAWDAQITAHANSSQLDIVETQQIKVTGGTLHTGQRFYSDPVNIQSISVAANGKQAQQLTQGTGAGQYQISTDTTGNIVLNYTLPTAANAGDSFVVQINFNVAQSTQGMVDWAVVPGTHSVPITSSTATINFPDGQMPDTSMVHVVQGNGTVTTTANSIIIKSQGAIPANQPFEIQVPVTAAAGNAGGNPVQPAPNGNPVSPLNPAPNQNPVPANPVPGFDLSQIPLSLICLGACILGVVVVLFFLFGGARLLRGLGGSGSSGSGGGGIFGGGARGGGGGFGGSGGGSANRGFRDSPNQNRNVPNVPNDKQSGGGGGFG